MFDGAIGAFAKVDATFKPRQRGDLKPDAVGYVGWRGTWEALWVVDGGAYAGQRAMGIYDPIGQVGMSPPFVWVPLCDLVVHSVLEEGIE